MRGQLSLESLLIAALSIALLSISITSLSSLVQSAGEKFQQRDAEVALSRLVFSSDDACLMGEGNSRLVDAQLAYFKLQYENGNLSLYYKNSRASQKARCKISVDQNFIFQKYAQIHNDGGTILISPAG